uniref:THAP-type domain-containing protein n=1 Tax=Sander lucioperca TaxID=283035 RepID=A0A8D0A4I1_SANLU
MPDSCWAIGCTNRRGEKPGLCFYRIPSDKENPERRQLWIQAIRRATVSGNRTWQPSQYTRMCSDHFIKDIQVHFALQCTSLTYRHKY